MKDTKDAVAYIRVSTNKEEQEQSYEAQQQYFKSIGINKLYCDQGLSGTTINRKGFSQMLYDCGLDIVKVKSGTSYKYTTRISNRQPKFHMIYTKSISRFSRDIATAVSVVRELRSKGVGVFFLDINQSSLDATTDLLLSIMFSISTEESKTMSSRIKFGNHQSALNGNIRSNKLYGYLYNIEEVYNKKRLQLEQQLHSLIQQLETYENPNDKLQAKIDRAKEITTKARKIYEEIPDTIDVSYFIEHYLTNITIVPVEDEPELFPKEYDIVVNHYIKDMLIELKSMVEECKMAKKGD